jgi:telomere-associated protein RIF1
MKSRGLEEIPIFDISEKAVNGVESRTVSTDEERFASGMLAKHVSFIWNKCSW